ncbi:MAG: site-2 protease family protein [Terriglobia bacterium]|nr:site-2 protease family protein [Terriglobia bacterium]
MAAVVTLASVNVVHLRAFPVIVFCTLVPSVILHEVSHGVLALAFGDDTAKRAGRLTLNPLPHIDPFGTVVLPALLAITNVGAFGWAKPVPVTISRLRRPRDHGLLVSLVGPAVNVLLAGGLALLYRFVVPSGDRAIPILHLQPLWAQILFVGAYVNVILAVFNLIPLPPLDGAAVLERMIPVRMLAGYYRLRPYTLVLPLALVVVLNADPSLASAVFSPVVDHLGVVLGTRLSGL